jgi:hypothetical protein
MPEASFTADSVYLPKPEPIFSNQDNHEPVPLEPVPLLTDEPNRGVSNATNGLNGDPVSIVVDSILESPITIELQSH